MADTEEEGPSPSILAAEVLRAHLDDIIEEGIRRTIGEVSGYALFTPEQLRPSVTAGFTALLHDLETPGSCHLGKVFAEIGARRTLQRFNITHLLMTLSLTEAIVRNLLFRHVDDPTKRLSLVERVHSACALAVTMTVEALWKISEELQGRTETLVRQLSSPLLQVYAGVLVLPLVGAVDAARAERIMDALLSGIVQHRAQVVIIDITGIAAAGAHTAEHLRAAARAAELLGAQVILVGMSAQVAQALVQEGTSLSGIVCLGNLQAGLDYALSRLGLVISPGPARDQAW